MPTIRIIYLKSQSWTPRASAISFLTFEAKSIGSAFSSSVGLCGGRNSSSTFATQITSVSHFRSVSPYFVCISITTQSNYLCRPVTCCINEAGEETMGLIPSPWNCISFWGHMVPKEEIQKKENVSLIMQIINTLHLIKTGWTGCPGRKPPGLKLMSAWFG